MLLTPMDLDKLKGVHPDLVRVVKRAAALSPTPFKLVEGLRTTERQRELLKRGATTTMNSRHLTGHAVDIAPLDEKGQVSWAWPAYYPLAKTIKQAAKDVGVSIEWGGDWKTFKDGPHWQLPWKSYPVKATVSVPKEVLKEAPAGGKPDTLTRSRIAQGSAAAATGGVVITGGAVADIVASVKDAETHLTAGNMISIAVGAVILGGALWALYARWDDAGRALPWARS